MAKSNTNGNCYICGAELDKTSMKNHILKEHCAEGDEECYVLVIEGAEHPDYWLIVDVNIASSFSSLDNFLRKIWLECCGHLSEFNFGKSDGDKLAKSKKFSSYEVGDKIFHTYDFGTYTETKISIAAKTSRPHQREAIRLLARNIAPSFKCRNCGEVAEYVCCECGGVYSEAFLCSGCAEKHGCNAILLITNSPRNGECGYEGDYDVFEYTPITKE